MMGCKTTLNICNITFWGLLLFTVSSTGFCQVSADKTNFQIHGSDFFEPWLPKYFETQFPNTHIEFNLTGSHSGLAALKSHYADASIYLGTNNQQLELPTFLNSTIIGYLVIYIHADKTFPSASISKDTFVSIAGISTLGEIEHWQQIFGDKATDGWESKQADILIDQSENKLTLGLTRLKLMDSDRPSSLVHVYDNYDRLIDHFYKNNGSLIITLRKEIDVPNYKTLLLIDRTDTIAFPPSTENVIYGDYSASFPIHLITNRYHPRESELIQTFQSTQLQELYKKHHILPNPDF